MIRVAVGPAPSAARGRSPTAARRVGTVSPLVRLQRTLGNRYVQRACAACRAGGTSCAGCEEEHRARRPAAIQREFDIVGKQQEASTYPRRVFFERGSATLDADEQAKVKALAAEPGAFELHGYVSEDEDDGVAKARVAAVDVALGSFGHQAARTPRLRPEAGRGRIGYRGLRAVEVVAPGAPAATPDCATIGQVVSCGEPPNEFIEANDEARGALTKAGSALAAEPLGAETAGAVRRLFGDPEQAVPKLKDNVAALLQHLEAMKTPGRHVCHNVCDPECSTAIAYNTGRQASAVMTLCPAFDEESPEGRVHALVHESSHGALGARDHTYSDMRRIAHLSTATALENADSYALLVRALTGLGSAPAPPADVLGGVELDEPDERTIRGALALVEAGLATADQFVTGIYGTLVRSRPSGQWDNSFYMHGMDMVQAVFPDTFRTAPGQLPDLREQIALAGLRDRLLSLRLLLARPQTVSADPDTEAVAKWSPGPGPSLTIGKFFFAVQPKPRVTHLLLELFLACGLPKPRASRYVALVLGLYRGSFQKDLE